MPLGKYEIFDAHCDTLHKIRNGGDLFDQALHFNLSAANRYARYIQVMAVWIDRENTKDCFVSAIRGIETCNKHKGNCQIIKTASELSTLTSGVGFLLGIEGGDALRGSLNNLQYLFDKGVRLVTLTWNHVNEISDSAMENKERGGLTSFGRAVVMEMERLGMAVDISHISEKGFWDVIDIAKKPVIASHSCAKTLCPHVRNLTDAQFDVLCENGGIVGINFYPTFLGGNTIDDILRHILHFLARGGKDYIGLGSDFDGVDRLPNGMCGTKDIYILAERLLKENLAESIVNQIFFQNMERYFLRILPK